MADPPLDCIIVGGGLAGGLTALALAIHRPEVSVGLFEAGETLGGNHRWSWFDGDLEGEAAALLAHFETTRWPGGHDVAFPGFTRHLDACYNSLASRDFDAGLRRVLSQGTVRTGCRVAALAADGITLANGERLPARSVIDCRDGGPAAQLEGGWQVFLGQTLRTAAPHGVACPMIMDATVEQPGAYRFVYLLPLGEHEIFVEDTYYADEPVLDAPLLRRRIADYAAARGWQADVIEEETGVLPVVSGGDMTAHRGALATAGVALAGARGGFAHPLTSYSLPFAAETALAIARRFDGDGARLSAWLDARARTHWERTGFYRMLGKMLMRAARPEERWRVFRHFYRLPEPLVTRFYAGRSTLSDRLRVLSGKPPVPVGRAVSALLGKGAPLVHGDR